MKKNNSTFEIDIQLASSAVYTPSTSDMEYWIVTTLATEIPAAEICIRIVDEIEMENLNATYRQQHKPTNVLSFPFDSTVRFNPPPLGDIVICANVVNKEANHQGKSREAHWAHMLIHGIYHLLGYDHVEDAAAEKMENLEIKALEKLNFPNPYSIQHSN